MAEDDSAAPIRVRPAAHLAVDARMVRHSGIGTYLRHLVPRLVAARPHWRFTILGPAEELSALGWAVWRNATLVDCRAPIYSVREQLVLPRLVPSDVQLFWTPHYVIPLLLGRRMLVTVQDVFHLAMPHLVGGVVRRAYAHVMFGAVRRRASRVLFTSEFTRGEFTRLAGAPTAGSDVVPLGVDACWGAIERVARDAPPYVLYAGNVKPHKNVAALVRAFLAMADVVPHELVIVGRTEGMRTADQEVAKLAARSSGRVRVVGEVSDASLLRWMAGADAFAFPSLYEGFGLPPLEAMAAGVPCLVSRSASLPEVCGDAALYCDAHDDRDIAARLVEVLTDEPLRDRLRERGKERAAKFPWDRCAQGTLRVIERTLAA
jgi:glycosyltransferase involved in cell wall biosynthesis